MNPTLHTQHIPLKMASKIFFLPEFTIFDVVHGLENLLIIRQIFIKQILNVYFYWL